MKLIFKLALLVPVIALSACAPAKAPQSRPPQTVLSVLFGQSNSDPGLEDMLTDKIRAEFPEVMIDWESVDWGDYFSREMRAKIASGEIPDLIIGKAQDVANYEEYGFLRSLPESLSERASALALPSVSVNGEVYGLPYNACYQGVIYNKDMLESLGIPVPATASALDQAIADLKEAGITPFAAHMQESWYLGNVTMQLAMGRVFNSNPAWGSEFREGKRAFASDDDYPACLEEVKKIFDNTWPDTMTVDQYECARRFANGEAAMCVTGSWFMQALGSMSPDMNVGIFPYPNEEGTAKLLFEPNLTFMVNGQGGNRDLAVEVVGSIAADQKLAKDICDFTQTESLLKGVESDSLPQLRSDITAWMHADVTLGNNQMLWQFQYSLALKTREWLEGETVFGELLRYADDNRALS
ncbi:MAG: ABC transporter substrate-binding protein [Clostridiales bacterium]|nr:ABC transporter substrate-binding protein [Clostridiales bacterium]